MLKVNVKLDIQAARRSFSKAEKEVSAAAAAALNRVSITARKAADQTIRERVTLKSADVKGAITVVYPFGRRTLIRDIQAVGDPIPLKLYQARRMKRGAVTFAVVRGQRKRYMRKGRPGFIVDKIGGHVFVRTTTDPPGPQKAKISKVFGPSLTQRFGTKKVLARITETVNNRWKIEFEREISFRRGAGRL